MKVKIGPYIHFVGPYQIADKIFFWVDDYATCEEIGGDPKLEQRWDYRAKKWLGHFLAHGFYQRDTTKRDYLIDPDDKGTWFYHLCKWIHSKRKRTIKVHIDRWDSWSADHTLSMIILPVLKQLRDSKHGGPYVDDEDVPDNLKSTAAEPMTEQQKEWGDVDSNHFKRWDYVLDEMIWAHEQHVLDDEPDFWIEEPEGMYFEPCADNPKLSTLKYDKEGKFDQDAYTAYHARLKNGFRLFGKYYQALWD